MKVTLEQEYKQAKRKSAKPMLWVSMISMTMMFAGLTSAYVVSRKRNDWVSFDLPDAFYTSTTLIVLSSITFLLAKFFIKKDNRQLTTVFLMSTFLLGVGFIFFSLKDLMNYLMQDLFLQENTVRLNRPLFMELH